MALNFMLGLPDICVVCGYQWRIEVVSMFAPGLQAERRNQNFPGDISRILAALDIELSGRGFLKYGVVEFRKIIQINSEQYWLTIALYLA